MFSLATLMCRRYVITIQLIFFFGLRLNVNFNLLNKLTGVFILQLYSGTMYCHLGEQLN